MSKDWIIVEDGQCQPCITPREWDLLASPYRFYRFLTDIEDALKATTTPHECDCLPALRRLVRKLVINSYWLRSLAEKAVLLQCPTPNLSSFQPASSTSVGSSETTLLNLYDETGFPLTVQIETHLPGAVSPIHSHGAWGIVAVLQGQEKNSLWKRQPEPLLPDNISCVGEKVFEYGDIISFMPTAIHNIESIGTEPLVTFNLYGETNRKQRFVFNAIAHQAKHY
ncbi:MAG: cupin [Cyanobacteria bacterium J06634_5]